MNDQEIDKLLERLDGIASDYDCELGLPTLNTRATNKMRQAVRDWLLGMAEPIVSADLLVVVIPEEWYK